MAQVARLTRATVLVVEDEALVRLELADRLADMGLNALMASDADEAIELLDAHPEIELMFTDITMPGSMDGLRLAHHVRDRWPPVKIIITSGRIETQLSALPLGSLFLPKPYGPEDLRGTFAQMMNGGAPARGGTASRVSV